MAHAVSARGFGRREHVRGALVCTNSCGGASRRAAAAFLLPPVLRGGFRHPRLVPPPVPAPRVPPPRHWIGAGGAEWPPQALRGPLPRRLCARDKRVCSP